ncbi:MAG: hypothetical protein IPO32_17120 [Crocinitomicaceae bacterium]|jgi:uncharacterized protein YacL|nr:hypothetical protein [Crocinitomicaceae bacterium]MBK9593140.1 hypothetical protein [Crocinitomicaceae bacterium]
MDESLENIEIQPTKVPQAVKTLAIFAYIGNAFWAIMLVVVLVWALVAIESFGRFITQSSTERLYFEPVGLIVGMLVGLVICIVPIIGAAMMSKGKKTGFWLYLIPSLVWIILNFASGQTANIIVALITVGFTVGFATQLKHLK